MRIKSCILLPAPGWGTQLFHLIFTEPGNHTLAHTCTSLNDYCNCYDFFWGSTLLSPCSRHKYPLLSELTSKVTTKLPPPFLINMAAKAEMTPVVPNENRRRWSRLVGVVSSASLSFSSLWQRTATVGTGRGTGSEAAEARCMAPTQL